MTISLNFFELLGVAFSYQQDLALIKKNYLSLQQKMHPDNFVEATIQEKQLAGEYAAFINEAYRVLTHPLKRAIYFLKLHDIDTQDETDTHMPADFLMEQMELRERLFYADQHPDPKAELTDIQNIVNECLQHCEYCLSELLHQPKMHAKTAKEWVRKMQFYSRLSEDLCA